MKKQERVKSNILFNEIIKKGTKVSNSYFSIFFSSANETEPKFGISAPKKVGNAVTRNKLKRQTRELVDQTKLQFKKNNNYIIIIKERCLHAAYHDKLAALGRLIGEINEKK